MSKHVGTQPFKTEILSGGDVVIHSKLSADALSAAAALPVGARMPDGTIYAGLSPDNGRPMFTTPVDVPLRHTFNGATIQSVIQSVQLQSHGHQDWRVPSEKELDVLFTHEAAIGKFSADLYWSSKQYDCAAATARDFRTGEKRQYELTLNRASVRCIRG